MVVKYQNGRGITKTAENRPKQRRNQYDKNMHHIGTSKDQHGEKTTEMISNNTEAVENAKMVEKHVNNNTRMKNVTSRGVEGIFPNLCKTQLGNVDFLLFISSRFLFLSLSYWYYFQSFLLSNEITFFSTRNSLPLPLSRPNARTTSPRTGQDLLGKSKQKKVNKNKINTQK